MKNLFLSAFAVLVSTGAAFATNADKSKKSAIVDGHYFDNNLNQCVSAAVDCSTIDTGQMCTWGSAGSEIVLREAGDTSCGNQLFKAPQP
jgi:hypothetical protein